jgi:hypothetical protein
MPVPPPKPLPPIKGARKRHDVCFGFPAMSDDEFAVLKDSVAKHGVREPIMLYKGLIIDGHHRARAWEELHPDKPKGYPTKTWKGSASQLSYFVMDRNATRRMLNLTTSQRAMYAAEAMRRAQAEPAVSKKTPGKARDKAAQDHNVSPSSVHAAATIIDKAPKLAAEVKAGTKTLGTAIKLIDGKPEQIAEPAKTAPEPPHPAFSAIREVEVMAPKIANALGKLDSYIKEICSRGLSTGSTLPTVMHDHVSKLRAFFKFETAHTPCPCMGKNKTCPGCAGRSWLPKPIGT